MSRAVGRRAKLDREAVGEDLCGHDMVPAFCALCRPLPVGVLARGFRTKGGDAYHNDDCCDWLRKGQRFAARKGRETHAIEPIAWHSVAPGQLVPCEACCTPEWIARHTRAEIPVWVDLEKLFGSSTSSTTSSPPGGLVLEVVRGDLVRWSRSADGGWIGVVSWTGRTVDGATVRAANQWVPSAALRPRG
jgi:hypothetical protein